MLDTATLDLIRQTAPLIRAQAQALNDNVYQALRNSHGEAYAKLAAAGHPPLGGVIAGYAGTLDRPDGFHRAVPRIALIHQQVQLQAQHFDMLHDALLDALRLTFDRQQLPEPALHAWGQAFEHLADLLIRAQRDLDQAEPQNV